MNEQTLTALRGSIAKWQAIVDGTGENNGARNCPLCRLFLLDAGGCFLTNSIACEGCPVFEKTGQRYCRGTPYEEYEELEDRDEPELLEGLAKEELAFLQTLLP